MKQRIISAVVALAILIPIIIHGGILFNIVAYIIGIIGLKEYFDAKGHKKEIPFPVQLIAYIFMSLIMLFNIASATMEYTLNYRIIAGLFVALLIPIALYHSKEKYSIEDAFYVIGGVLLLGVAFSLLIMLRSVSLKLFAFLFVITITTDTFAYVTGSLIGKHKLIPDLSPKKTLEGLIGGLVMGVFISMMFYHTCINPELSLYYLFTACFFLSLIAQFGDLIFSAIKRYFGIKDFSNLMPGHGGVLDRLDSIIFVVFAFIFFTLL